MQQLVQLQEQAGDLLKKHKATVLVIFREETEGQEGLERVVERTKTDFKLALDLDAEQTRRYSPGRRVHDSYLIDSQGIVRAVLNGTRYDRAKADEFIKALNELARKRP